MCGVDNGYGDKDAWNYCLQSTSVEEWVDCIDPTLHGPAHLSLSGSWRTPQQKNDSEDCSQWFGWLVPDNYVYDVDPPLGICF